MYFSIDVHHSHYVYTIITSTASPTYPKYCTMLLVGEGSLGTRLVYYIIHIIIHAQSQKIKGHTYYHSPIGTGVGLVLGGVECAMFVVVMGEIVVGVGVKTDS